MVTQGDVNDKCFHLLEAIGRDPRLLPEAGRLIGELLPNSALRPVLEQAIAADRAAFRDRFRDLCRDARRTGEFADLEAQLKKIAADDPTRKELEFELDMARTIFTAPPPMTDEEMEARLAEGPGRPLAEILKDLCKLP